MFNQDTVASVRSHFDAVIAGAGWAGIYMLYKLRQLGMDVRVYEAGGGVGGTWFWNRYPGSRCDTPSLQYSYSFDEVLQQEWHWTELYAAQPEIERYANHVVDRFGLRPDIEFDTRVISAAFDEEEHRWLITTEPGGLVSADYCIMATGGYSVPVKPPIMGIDSFAGELYYTATWPSQAPDFSGKKVGIVGTGSSGMQVATSIARDPIDHLYIFQRTANFLMPARNAPVDPQYETEYKATYRERRDRARYSRGGLEVPPVPQASGPTATLTDEEFHQRADLAWQLGGMVALTTTFPDLVKDEDANQRVADYLRSKVHKIVRNPDVAELLCARGHYLGSRRILTADDYFTIFDQDNVTLVDVNSAPIRSFLPTGITTGAAEYSLDTIILATGFDSGSGAMLQVDFKGKGGSLLRDKWGEGPVTYLGIGVEGFPNLFMIAQAGSPGIRSHVMVSVEQHVEWISSLIEHARERGVVSIEPTREAELTWTAYVADVVAGTLLTRDDTSYIGSNIAGKPRVYTSYVGGVGTYRRICENVQSHGYEGWTLITSFDDISGQREWRGPDL